MAVLKLSSSKKQLQVILGDGDSPGDVFGTSADVARRFIVGDFDSKFLLLSKMPFGTSPFRFPRSKVFDGGVLRVDGDAMDRKFVDDKRQALLFADKRVDF